MLQGVHDHVPRDERDPPDQDQAPTCSCPGKGQRVDGARHVAEGANRQRETQGSQPNGQREEKSESEPSHANGPCDTTAKTPEKKLAGARLYERKKKSDGAPAWTWPFTHGSSCSGTLNHAVGSIDDFGALGSRGRLRSHGSNAA